MYRLLQRSWSSSFAGGALLGLGLLAACNDQPTAPAVRSRLKPSNVYRTITGETARLRIGSFDGSSYPDLSNGLNRAGAVTGSSLLYLGGGSSNPHYAHHAFIWKPGNSRPSDLGTLPNGTNSFGDGINNLGQVAGYNSTYDGLIRATLWTPATGWQDLGTLGGHHAQAHALNDSGVVVGASEMPNGNWHAFIWTAGGGMRDLAPGHATSTAVGVNNAGQIVGTVDGMPALWQPNGDLVVLAASGAAKSINDSGHVVGFAIDANLVSHAFLWTPAAGLRDLGTLGGDGGYAMGLNDKDQVVGSAQTSAGTWHAFLWTPSDGMEDMEPVTAMSSAWKVTDNLEVIGQSVDPAVGGEDVHFLAWHPRDVTPPVIAPVITGTLGTNGWYVSDVSLSWSVTDPESAVSSSTGCGAASVTADTPGQTFICTATSAGGTASDTIVIKRDATPPVVAYSGNAGSYTVDLAVTITCSATDATSGVASTTCADIAGPAYSFAVGTNSFGANATDNAGNTGSGSTSFTVVVTPSALAIVTRVLVADAGISSSLCAKLNAAAAAANAQAKAGQLTAYANEVRAQTGKSISDANAAILLRLVAAM